MKTWHLLAKAVAREGTAALVSLVAVAGSAPRDAGTRLVVTRLGFHGTIGGGALEWRALAEAQALLGQKTTRAESLALGPALGQCCGGKVELLTEVFVAEDLPRLRALAAQEAAGPFSLTGRIVSPGYREEFGRSLRPLFLFGAGHVGRALVLALAPLPFAITWVDSRPAAFPAAFPANVTARQADNPTLLLAAAPIGSFVLVMTHSHALDLALVATALAQPQLAYVGLIGSATKRARFEARLREGGLAAERIAALVCPIGMAGITSKEPASIAASTVAQLLAHDETLKKQAEPRFDRVGERETVGA